MAVSLHDWYTIFHARKEYYLARGYFSREAMLHAAADANKLAT